MYSLEVYINDERLELFSDETVSLNSSIQNIKDISKVFTDFTQSFNVPASKNNNKIFKHWYNADIYGGFSASVRQEAEIKLNGVSYKIGKIQLESVALKNSVADSYKITFYGKLINLTDLFKDDLLSSLNLAAYSHDYSYSNVKQGLQTGLFNGDVIYPLISSERNWDYNSNDENEIKYTSSTGINYKELKPAIKVNRIIQAIENKYNVTFSSDFFNNSQNEIDELFIWLNGTSAGTIGSNKIDIDFTSGDTDNVDLGTNIGTFRTYNTSASNDRIKWRLRLKITPNFAYPYIPYTVRVYDEDEVIYEKEYGINRSSLTIDEFIIKNRQNGEDIYNLRFEIECPQELKFTSELSQKKIWSNTDLYYDTYGAEQTISNELTITNNLPKIKVKDFFMGLIKIFNLVIEPITFTKFKVDTLDDWYNKGGEQDLTAYLDNTSYDVKKPTLYKNINFKYEEPEAILNAQYYELYKTGYGDLNAEFDVDGGILDIAVPFENMMFERLTDTTTGASTNIQVGSSFDKELEPVLLPPVLFYNRGSLSNNQYFGLVNDLDFAEPIGNYLNVGSENSYVNGESTTSVNFKNEISTWNLSTQGVSLYNSYWKDYITDLFDDRRREYDYKLNLPLKVVKDLQLNDLIKIGNKSYIINNYNLNLNTGEINLTLLNYIGYKLTLSSSTNLVADLSGVARLNANLTALSAKDVLIELIGTSTLTANATQYSTVKAFANIYGSSKVFAHLSSTFSSDIPNNSIGVLKLSDAFTKTTDLGSVSGAVTIDWSLAGRYLLNLTGNVTITMTNYADYDVIKVQDIFIKSASDSYTITWQSGVNVDDFDDVPIDFSSSSIVNHITARVLNSTPKFQMSNYLIP